MPKDIDPREDEEPGGIMVTPNEATVDIPIDDSDPEKVLKIGSQLDPVRAKELTNFLKANLMYSPGPMRTCAGYLPRL